MAITADYTLYFAADQGGYIYYRRYVDQYWYSIYELGQQQWVSLAATRLNANETRLVAAAAGGSIWTASIRENGSQFWAGSVLERTAAGSRAWTAVALSADASNLVAVARGGFVHRSTDGGATWEVPYRWAGSQEGVLLECCNLV